MRVQPLLYLICLAGLMPAAAQQPSAAGELTIQEAIDTALSRNLNLAAERLNISVAEARLITARLRPNPLLTIGNDYTDTFRQHFTPENGGGPPEYTARVDYPFERAHKRERRITVAENARAVVQMQFLNTTRQLTLDVQNAFVDVQAAQESVRIAELNLGTFNNLIRIGKARVNAGDLAPVELMRTEVAALQYQNAVRQARLRLRTARNRLAGLMGRSELVLPSRVVADMRRDTPVVTTDSILQHAIDSRPDLEALRRDQIRSQADLRLQIATGKVDLSVGVQWHHQYGPAHGDAMGYFLAVPIAVYNRNQGEIARAQREQQQIATRISAMQNDITTEVQNAYETYDTARAQLESLEKDQLPKAEQTRKIMEYSYQRGEASLIELLDAQRVYNESVQGLNDAHADYARSLYLIDSVSGQGNKP